MRPMGLFTPQNPNNNNWQSVGVRKHPNAVFSNDTFVALNVSISFATEDKVRFAGTVPAMLNTLP